MYQFGCPSSGAQETLFKFVCFFFQLYFNKKYVEVAINDFIMHLISWYERRNCLRKCFPLSKYIMENENVHFSFFISLQTSSKSLDDINRFSCNSLCTTCCIFLAQIVLQLSQVYSHTNFVYEYVNSLQWSLRKKNNLENNLQRKLRTEGPKECIFRASGDTNFKKFSTHS